MSDRRLAAVMVTDMVGFTALLGADQDHALQLLDRGHGILKSIITRHGGEWLEDAGDRSLSAFPTAIQAVLCALEILSGTKDEPELNFRIGVDVGEIVGAGRHVYGEAINIAALIERLADPNGLVITQAAFELVDGSLDLDVLDLGQKMLKNVAHPVHLYALTGTRRRSRARSFVSALMARRVPHVLGAYLAAGWAVIEVTQWLAENDVFAPQWVYAAFAGLLALIPSVVLITYTHGAHGRDRATVAEKVGVPVNLLLAAVVIALVQRDAAVPANVEGVNPASVAVLPFANLSGDESSDYFSFLSEELINALSRVPGIYVAPRASLSIYGGTAVEPRDVASDLRVAKVLEGTLQVDGGQVRVTAQLFDGEDNSAVWSRTFVRELTDVFLIPEDIARAVVGELGVRLRPAVESVLASARAATLEAYDFYLQGLSYLRQPPTAATLGNARRLLERALEEDDSYAKAHAVLCEVELEQYVLDRSSASIDVAETECLNALRLDTSSREVRYALGTLYRHTGNYERSELLLRELLSEQVSPRALTGLASTLDARGEYAQAEPYFRDAIAMEPGNWHSRMALAEFYYWRCRFEDALAELGRVIALSPDNPRAHLILGAVYYSTGDIEASLRETSNAIDISPSRGAYRDLGFTYHYSGEYDQAVEAFRKALDLGPDNHWTWGNIADTYAAMGQSEVALEAYRRAADLAQELLARNPRDWITMAYLASYNVMIGRAEQGQEQITTAVANAPRVAEVHFMDAVVRSRLDQRDQALDALESAVELGCYPRWMIAAAPQFAAHKDDDRFKSLIAD